MSPRAAVIDFSEPFVYTNVSTLTAGEFITSGLVLAYKFDQLSGQAITDYSPSGLTGQLGSTGGSDGDDPVWINPRGLDFVSSDVAKVVTPNTPLRLTTALSVEVRFRWNSAIASSGLYDKTGGGSTNQNYQVFVEGNVLKFRALKSAGINDLVGPTLTSDQLYHVVATYDGVTMRLYVDGADIGTTTSVAQPLDNVDGNVHLGFLGSGVFPLQGKIYKVSVYNRALTPAEVTTLYAN